jgi:DNA polymerase type B, organellar and viral
MTVNGGKITGMEVQKYKMIFRDSLNFNPQSLAKWPETFGLTDVSKGIFPHRFNRPENWNDVVPYPEKKEFSYEVMKAKEKAEFDQWYEKDRMEKQGQYNFREEFVRYCSMDVTVLRKCCLLFRELFMGISGGMCPFVTAMTIAGLCNKFWRAKILKENQIGLIPTNGFHKNRLQSAKALKWMSFVMQDEDLDIQHRDNGGEKRVQRVFVDGYCENNNTVYEFHGCW